MSNRFSFKERIPRLRFFKKRTEDDPDFTTPSALIIGSLPNCNKKDALAYARGLANWCLVSKENGWLRVKPHGHGYLFEIQEGGAGFSLMDEVLKVFPEDGEDAQIFISVNQSTIVEVGRSRGQFYSLIQPPVEELSTGAAIHMHREYIPFSDLVGKSKMAPLIEPPAGTNGNAVTVGLVLLVGLSFLAGAEGWTQSRPVYDFVVGKLGGEPETKAQATAADAGEYVKRIQDNPIIQFQRARKASVESGKRLVHLKKENGRWTWSLE